MISYLCYIIDIGDYNMKNFILFLAISLSTIQPAWPHQYNVTINDSPGGYISDFIKNRSYYEHKGIMLHISGDCMSACIIYTGMKDVCLEHDANIFFHQGSNTEATDSMMKLMNNNLWQYVEHYGSPLPTYISGEFLFLSAEEAVTNKWMKYCD